MEKSVNGIRENFYHDLIDDYQYKGKKSFLYRFFWEENIAGLLEKYFPRIPVERPLLTKDESEIRERMTEAMKERPEWGRSLLLREVPGNTRKERRDFWEELWLNDIGYKADLISDSEYYLWLVEYLAARDIYYKDIGIDRKDRHSCLYPLLFKGLQDTENALKHEQLRKEGKNIRTKAQVGRDLTKLAELVQKERDKVASRLHDLKVRAKDGNADYLPCLTKCLEQMALHIKIKTWLQDSGYPFRGGDGVIKSPKGVRKQDFSMRLFEAYCDSEKGYDFIRKDMGGRKSAEGWHVDVNGFCIMEPARMDCLLGALEENEKEYLFLPLAVDLFSGCIFFLAGKENYREVYKDAKEELESSYQNAKASLCFDYLRLDKIHKEDFLGNSKGIFRLEPVFHKNAGRKYSDVLDDFKRYCITGDGNPREIIRHFNEEAPAGIPDAFRWAFDFDDFDD